ncbi:mediator of RNA polymerase II transcription subunit 12-like [Macadamia integrifolia]|uniref:mediator of RNA polymerase II transcription subunit 12-like n=1 Tax=Macadamia integrifolia TaxID=60698 RepID=UPI001C4F214C|nr:mediator of RNA polymerase II transcription subunit 12-like [Macadamia integrifolia]XP_042503823.1 mediator of RNA polymerase II transcription subunit 12-like [Macadamia integrifolia]XP_042503825.1 mediator of RNA polymerase II transcription subunit 12-like [Macadamia integrifolia]
MQRFSATGCGGGVNNGAVGGTSARDTARADPSFPSSNLPLNTRRPSTIIPYKLKCDKEPLNCRLGPPDFCPPVPNCHEETLTKEYAQSGYKETIEGLEEAREILLSQLGSFTKPVVLKCKEAIRKHLRAINESRAQKRKAGQVYGVPLSGNLLLKPGVFPEQTPCGEDFRKKWVESLSQHHKQLRALADHVPHGYRKRGLFEVLIKHNVPFLRATWFIKVTYLNQGRPTSANISSGPSDKPQSGRTEQWTKNVIDYLQVLLDEFLSKDGSLSTPHRRDQPPQMLLAGFVHKDNSAPTIPDGEEPSLHFKWWYMVRILQWNHAEGLLLPSYVIDWVLSQLQEKESLETLELLLPIIFGMIETIVLSQIYVRNLVEVAVHCIQESTPGGSDVVDNFRRAYTVSAVVEMLRYLIVTVPDTFVALDCFCLPPSVLSGVINITKGHEDTGEIQYQRNEMATMCSDKRKDSYHWLLSFDHVVSSIQKRADTLAKAVSPGLQGHGLSTTVQALDKALLLGDLKAAYSVLFEDLCDGGVQEVWISEVSPCLQSSLKWIGTVSLSFVCAVFFLCEWATCDFRDCRTSLPRDVKFTGRIDFSQVYCAVILLKLKMEDMRSSVQRKNGSPLAENSNFKSASHHESFSGGTVVENVSVPRKKSKSSGGSIGTSGIFQSPGPLHDIVVCWIDQHDAGKGEGFNRLQLLIMELIRSGIFYPHAYVRQLIISGIMDRDEAPVDLERRKRHHRLLKQLPGLYMLDALKEARIAEVPLLVEVLHVYSNERRLLLHGLISGHLRPSTNGNNANLVSQKEKGNANSGKDSTSAASLEHRRNLKSASSPLSSQNAKTKAQVAELKSAISMLLHFPNSCPETADTRSDESQGSLKRSIGSIGSKFDATEGTNGCEECKRAKRQKSREERSTFAQGYSPNPSDDEDTWWMRKGPKSVELKDDPPLKLTKHAHRGRQKIVRKTQSLSQLAAAGRIEGSQGASTSHICDNRISCPHYRTGTVGDVPKSVDGIKNGHLSDIFSIGKALKQKRILEKRAISVWLISLVRQHVEGTEKTPAKIGQCPGAFPPIDDKSSVRWKLGEDELSSILYLMDVSSDLVSAIKFLLWLLPKALASPNSTTHGGRSILMLPKNMGSHGCEVGERFLLSCIQRYENILVATDLIPEALSAAMHRSVAVMTSNGRASCSAAFVYARNLLKKYGNVASVVKWENNFKVTCDQKLLAELESTRSVDGEYSLGVPAGVEDLDDFFRQKISVRLSRSGPSMKEVVQRHIEEAVHYFYGKERKSYALGNPKSATKEKWDDGYQVAQQIVLGLMDCIRQNGGTAQEGDPSSVASAISAIVSNVGPALAKLPDFTPGGNYQNFPSTISSLNFAQRLTQIHITCLCLLKEALGERQSRVFEIAFATEASSAVAGAFAPGKAPRSQFQVSPEAQESNMNLPNEMLNNSAKLLLGRAGKIVAAVSALVVGVIVHGVTSLERMVSVLRIKEGLDVLQFIRSARSSSNGISRYKVDNSIDVYVHWFRLLIGNCRMVCDGLVVELLGEPYILALSRMQRMLPLSLVFPPAYSIFALVIWRTYILTNISIREDVQFYQSLALAIADAIKHQPFRDVCLRDTHALYDLLASDVGDTEFAAMLEMHGPDKHFKTKAFVPLRARLFLNAVLDCKMPPSATPQDEGTRARESKVQHAENEMKLQDQLVHILDRLQPAKFHWQWVELRLLLNEQALVEKIETHNISLVEAFRSLSPNADNFSLSENENNFTDIVLTRLLVRPDAAPLYSEVVHLLGRSLEESLLLHAKWFLAGQGVLFGRKSIRQRLLSVAQQRGLPTKVKFWKPWGWSNFTADLSAVRGEKRKYEASSLEEGEVVEDGVDVKRLGRVASQSFNAEGLNSSQQFVTERALVDLVLPCIDRSSNDSRTAFANDLIKQMISIEQQINTATRGAGKQAGTAPSGIESATNKGNSRKVPKSGSPGLGRRTTGTVDSAPPSSAALRASMWLRLQFLLRLLPIIYGDREPSGRDMRHMLALVILRLLGSRVVHEDADLSFQPMRRNSNKREVDSPMVVLGASPLDLSGDRLFDRFLSVFHGLLSSCKPSWLKPKSASKSTVKSPRFFSVFDREVAESLQNDLDHMQLPENVRWRIQTAMPMLPPSLPCSISCQPPAVSTASLAVLQASISVPSFQQGGLNAPPRIPVSLPRSATNLSGKSKLLPSQDQDLEVDPWMLLEDGTGSGPSSSNSNGGVGGDHANLKACNWLKGAVRVRRTDLTYIGAVDDDS